MQSIHFAVKGFYLNGDEYFSNHYNIFELQELLDEWQHRYSDFYAGNGNFEKSEVLSMDTVAIETINHDGDYLSFDDNKEKIKTLI